MHCASGVSAPASPRGPDAREDRARDSSPTARTSVTATAAVVAALVLGEAVGDDRRAGRRAVKRATHRCSGAVGTTCSISASASRDRERRAHDRMEGSVGDRARVGEHQSQHADAGDDRGAPLSPSTTIAHERRIRVELTEMRIVPTCRATRRATSSSSMAISPRSGPRCTTLDTRRTRGGGMHSRIAGVYRSPTSSRVLEGEHVLDDAAGCEIVERARVPSASTSTRTRPLSSECSSTRTTGSAAATHAPDPLRATRRHHGVSRHRLHPADGAAPRPRRSASG